MMGVELAFTTPESSGEEEERGNEDLTSDKW
jgi:hypothetical protein